MNRLQNSYINKIVPELKSEFALGNNLQVPKINKLSVNVGIGSFRDNREMVESFVSEMQAFTGQKPYPRKSRLSVSNFKIRQNDVVGYAVTLRNQKMWSFIDKLINISLPRVRDFRGISDKAFDKNGNYSLGIKEHVIFPEVNSNTTKGIRSLQVTFVFNTSDILLNKALLSKLGMPFRKN